MEKTYNEIITALSLAQTHEELKAIEFSHLDGLEYDCAQHLYEGVRKRGFNFIPQYVSSGASCSLVELAF